jgi:hypothetical protein
MAKIDDPLGQIKAGAEKPPKSPGAEIALRMTNWIPVIGKTVRKALDAIRGQDKDERLEFLITAIIEQLEAHESSLDEVSRRLDEAEFTRLVSVTIERIFFGANERRIKRFAAVLTNAATVDKSQQDYEDAAAFIRALDELSEDDLRVLKHLYNHQSTLVNENHAMSYNTFFPAMNTMLASARNLGMQMDDFFSRCNRLSGYGLAIELSTKHATMGNPDDFAFRLTLLGKRLIQMLIVAGEEMRLTRR